MKVGKFTHGGRSAAGLVVGDQVHRLEPWHDGPSEWHRFALPAASVAELQALPVLEKLPLAELGFAAPIDAASKVVCIGLNYRDHADEAGRAVVAKPGLFLRTFDTLQPHAQPIVRPAASADFDYEGEIAVVIGKAGRCIAAEDAMSHVFGYTCLLDGSLRDFQKHSVTAGKNFWRSGAIGPWITTADEVPDWRRLSLATRLNGTEVQRATAAMMIHAIPDVIAYVSQWAALRPGDVIATGTPAGVGLARTPPLWMKAGDRIEVTVDAVGTLANDVEDEA